MSTIHTHLAAAERLLAHLGAESARARRLQRIADILRPATPPAPALRCEALAALRTRQTARDITAASFASR